MKVIEFCRTLRSDEAQCLVGHDADLSKAALAEPPEKGGYGGLGVKGLMFRVLGFLKFTGSFKGVYKRSKGRDCRISYRGLDN